MSISSINGLKIAVLSLFLVSCGVEKQIIDKPIVFNEERKVLTIDYLKRHYGLEQTTPEIVPKMIVLHWTVVPTLEKTYQVFKDPILPNYRKEITGASPLNVSSQFLVDQDGTIYRLMPETTMARHVIGLNHCAIGIENVGGTADLPLTELQVKANIKLVKYLSKKYPIDYLIGHYEYTNFENHPLWLEKDQGYRTEKTDPGQSFVEAVQLGTLKCGFKDTPTP
ncbi:peptidoglycan recognition family protein [Formosa algae]|uniref:N-acetylmuramoyl-L-alanine amidase n=1 Tax=Formosa algae TaxID=225843 RepID=A0A9X0YLS3_9FLAO|nr:peptidoglycan recognition family protein [Formosa algae]MBP1839271.1 N-acetyl-anhydromuramyl-L-alanine amidase AmpD [Formosa algae]MDQ0334048.1 N-acetyl-anhydromuramyl-L-alanine amidase AmpD [Formosa algae]